MKKKIRNGQPSLFLFMFFGYWCNIYADKSADGMILNSNFSATALPSSQVHTWSPDEFSEVKFKFSNVFRASTDGSESPKISAAIFQNEFTRTFSVSPGTNFIRLHFYPISYSGLKLSKALFSVSIGQYTLLTTSASSYPADASDTENIIKEFCVKVNGQILNVTFTPSLNISGAYGFVNKIEVVSVPSNLYIRENISLPLVGLLNKFHIQKSIALETMHRVNIGGHSVSAEHDSGMFRAWSGDKIFLLGDQTDTETLKSKAEIKYGRQVPSYVAPENVYATARTMIPGDSQEVSNMTWAFPIESGFYYLIRLHFCEISEMITQENQRVFGIYINGLIAEDHADVIHWSGEIEAPVYRDYVVNLSGHGIDTLLVTLQSNTNLLVLDSQAILNGLEIFKFSDANNNLSGSSPFGATRMLLLSSSDNHQGLLGVRLIPLYLLSGIVVLFSVCFIFLHIPLGWLSNLVWRKKTLLLGESEHFRYFSLSEIKSATNNFSNSLVIGAGGFGKVYKGHINGSTTSVAIKRANPCSNQGLNEFKTEISLLSNLRHGHLVPLIGYCMENKEMILIYDHMARGTLRDHLYNNHKPLKWNRRLKICIGAARGLHYLHTGSKHTIIHRDVKSTNILLDENWVAKVSDFGLSKIGPNWLTQSNTHVSTAVKGSFGYLDPEYYRRRKLTEKSDVYSLGVVLFEVLCARPAVLPMAENEEEEHEKVNLADWALRCYQSGTLDTIIDPYLQGKIDPECFKTFTDMAKRCLADRGSDRPHMGDVLWNLELAWRQQEAADYIQEDTVSAGEANRNMNGHACIEIGNSDQSPGIEFSEIMVPTGR